MEKEILLKAHQKLKILHATLMDEPPYEEGPYRSVPSAWEFAYVTPKPPLDTNPFHNAGIRPRRHKQGA